MITQHLLKQRIGRPIKFFAPVEYVTPTGLKIMRLCHRICRTMPFVSRRRFLLLKVERDQLIHELHLAVCLLNNLQSPSSGLSGHPLPVKNGEKEGLVAA